MLTHYERCIGSISYICDLIFIFPMRNYIWVFLAILIAGCDIFDKDETIPGYVYIESADLSTNELTEGANTSNIVDATVFANDEFMGTFELPATVPILINGPVNIKVGAGIRNNGLSSDRRIYPFYDFYTEDIELFPHVVTPLGDSTITFQYFDSGLYFTIEDFEETIGSQLLPLDNNTADFLVTIDEEEVLSGDGSLKIELTPENSVFEARTVWDFYNLPTGANMYLELDFKGNHYLEVGILAQNPQRKIFALGLNPTDEWTKVYIELTDEISSQFNADPIEIYFQSVLSTNNTAKTLYLDNLKFIHP